MLATIRSLLEQLNGLGIGYCHWKSNWAMEQTLQGETDLDLLVHRHDAKAFRAVLIGLGFEPSIETGVEPLPATEHYHALDTDTAAIVHVHVYYKVISGESIAKNYRLPLEEMLLDSPRLEGLIKIPVPGAELIVFVIRMMIKHTTPVELAFLFRDWANVRREMDWLVTDYAIEEADRLLRVWLPRLSPELFSESLAALRQQRALWKRVGLGYRVRAALRGLRRKGLFSVLVTELSRFGGLVIGRLRGSPQKLTPAGGGAIVAFVGSEASGKTTLLADAESWLGAHYTVSRVHAGKPPATPLTMMPHVLLPTLRRLLPAQRSTKVEAGYMDGTTPPAANFPLVFGVRSLMLALERKKLLSRALAKSSNGEVVLSDRYPSSRSGAPDSAQLEHLADGAAPSSLRGWMASRETRMYRDIPKPDLVIHLLAPLDVTLARNMARTKVEDEAFVRTRHLQASSLQFDGIPVVRIDTNQPLEATIRQVREAIWNVL